MTDTVCRRTRILLNFSNCGKDYTTNGISCVYSSENNRAYKITTYLNIFIPRLKITLCKVLMMSYVKDNFFEKRMCPIPIFLYFSFYFSPAPMLSFICIVKTNFRNVSKNISGQIGTTNNLYFTNTRYRKPLPH